MTEQKRKKRNKAQAAQEVQEAAGDMPIKGKAATGAADPKEQEAAIMEEAARITGKPAADLTAEQAEAVVFDEIGTTTPKTPAEKAHNIIIKNMETAMQQANAHAAKAAQEVQEHMAREYNLHLQAMENAGGLAQLVEMINAIRAAGAPVTKTAREMAETAAAVQKAIKGISDFVNSDAYKAIIGSIVATASLVQEHRADFDAIRDASDRVKDLALFLIRELKESDLSEQYTLQDVIEQGFDANGNTIDSPFREIIERAEKRLADFEKKAGLPESLEQAAELLPIVTYTKKPGIELTTAKLSNIFFAPNAPKPTEKDINGQMSFIPLKYERDGAKSEITLFYNYFFDEEALKKTGLPKNVDDQDYFILSHIWDNYMAGNTLLTVRKLYKDMTGDDPNDREKEALTKRLIRLATTSIFINDKEVSEAWGLPTYNEGVTRLAPIDIGTKRFVSNGQIADGGIEILKPPAIMQLSYEMGQYTTVPKALLHVKKANGRRVSRTTRFYRIMHFLIRRIAAAKSGNLSKKILYNTLYEETGEAKTTNGQRAALKTMYEILDHFKACGWIDGYREETTKTTGQVGVVILTKSEKPPLKGKAARKLPKKEK